GQIQETPCSHQQRRNFPAQADPDCRRTRGNLCNKPSGTLLIDQSTHGLVEGQRTLTNHQPNILSSLWNRDEFRGSSVREKVQRIPRLQTVKTSKRSFLVSTGKTVGGHRGHGQQYPRWCCQNGLWKRPGRPHVDPR